MVAALEEVLVLEHTLCLRTSDHAPERRRENRIEEETAMTKTVVGLMDNSHDAQKAVQELESDGFGRENIRIMAEEAPSEGLKGKEEIQRIRGTEGGVGAVEGGAASELKRMGIPDDDARNYAEGVRRGGILVTVRCDDDVAGKAAEIMSRNGAIDVENRALSWGTKETSRFEGRTGTTASPEREGVIPVVEEEVQIGKRQVATGGVRVYSHVTEQPVEEQVTLREERAKVERRPVDRPATEAEGAAFKEQSFEIRETAEEPVVSKQARVKEEVLVGKEAVERTEQVHDTVRRTEVEVEKSGEFGKTSGEFTGLRSGAGEDSEFLTHFSSNYATKGERFDAYRSAYHYAENMSADPKLQGRDWPEVEEDIHQDWEKSHPGTWTQFKDAIHYGWKKTSRH